MNITSKHSRIMLLSVICILAPILTSCGKESADFLKFMGEVAGTWAVNETLNCAANKKDCITNADVKPTIAPDKAIENYYKLINQRQYTSAWTVLSPEFHMRRPELNYNIYTQWWDKVNFVEIDSIDIIEQSKNKAIVNAKLKYLMKDGTQDDDKSGRFTLVLNSDGKWLIDDKN
ncbi:hypothetical protein A0J48_022220 [Sphaerospermopsis aphanizomenoides BCCUSP55]|uniref:DUF3887 domain-containing protein n=1 Tax=Sphaerospermopsis aphanizomenoides TaxID=459663 RepID=UPI001F2DAF37|nr:DUF3887 domain-containing protein [Sphaerospermopsis aphanizomenoides]MBK1990205.1 hypothetical protein [Sphaerospermopsis aphanizomenoides BCCUSP55]